MEITTSTGVRGTALSGGPPTKATGDGSPPLTGKTPAEALSASGEKPSAGDRPPRDPHIAAAAGAAVALLRSGEDGYIDQQDAESLFEFLVDDKLAEKAEAFYGNYFVTPVLLHLAKLIEEHGAVGNSIYKKVEAGVKSCFDSMLKNLKGERVICMVLKNHSLFERQLLEMESLVEPFDYESPRDGITRGALNKLRSCVSSGKSSCVGVIKETMKFNTRAELKDLTSTPFMVEIVVRILPQLGLLRSTEASMKSELVLLLEDEDVAHAHNLVGVEGAVAVGVAELEERVVDVGVEFITHFAVLDLCVCVCVCALVC